jgi:hypothetical protein
MKTLEHSAKKWSETGPEEKRETKKQMDDLYTKELSLEKRL